MMTCLEHRKPIVLNVRYESIMVEQMTKGKATWYKVGFWIYPPACFSFCLHSGPKIFNLSKKKPA